MRSFPLQNGVRKGNFRNLQEIFEIFYMTSLFSGIYVEKTIRNL